MSLSRRDLLKIAVAGGAAMTLPLERVAFTSGSAKRMATSAMPKPFTLPFVTPPTLGSSGSLSMPCPDGMTRKSVSFYYYTNGRPDEERSAPHDTIFRKTHEHDW